MARKEEAYEYLKRKIITGELKPESPIAELAVSAELNISRTPIREALRELEAEGLVVSYPARGCFVTALTASDVEEVFALRILLERWAIEHSIYQIPEHVIEELMQKFREAADPANREARFEAERALHAAIVEYAGSKRLVSFMRSLDSQVERLRYLGGGGAARRDAAYREQVEVLARLRERDLPGCRYALSQHLKNAAAAAMGGPKLT